MPDITFKFQAILDLIDSLPTELITLRDEDYSIFSACTSAIRWHLQHPQEMGKQGFVIALHRINEFGGLNPLALISDMLGKCPDEFPSADTRELPFISDEDFRDSLRNDLSAVNRALSNSEWKAATVLAGSVIEALLLWRLDKEDSQIVTEIAAKVNKNLSKVPMNMWHLPDYLETAAAMKLITEDSANQARLAKNFRNLIHPGRSQRLGQACNRGTAFAAVAAVEFVIQDLSR